MEKKNTVKKVLKIILIIIVALILIFAIHTIRNYVIITNLQNKNSNYQNITNYHIKSVANSNNGATKVIVNYYKKDNKQYICVERTMNGEKEKVKVSMYDNGERVDMFTETSDSKTAKLNSGEMLPLNISNYLETASKWQTFLESIVAKIKTTNFNGKECYVVRDFLSLTSLTYEGAEVYIDKETGLAIKTTEAETVTEKEYEFDKVEDSIFTEPDISQYKLQENE